jgi:acyl dehydratase
MGTYLVAARNFSTANENKIHSDDVARTYGFTGALVPGVAVYGHVTYPLVERFGAAWLSGSIGSVRLIKPTYHGDQLTITTEESGGTTVVRCHTQDNTLVAELTSTMPDEMPGLVTPDCLTNAPKNPERPDIAWDNVVVDQPFNSWQWQVTSEGNRTMADQISDALDLYQTHAHPHWLQSVANQTLSREYVMPVWLHVGTEMRLRQAVMVGDTLKVRSVPIEKWRNKGHEFIKLYISFERDGEITTEIFHTAIFKVAA